jgi:hypothetical protein
MAVVRAAANSCVAAAPAASKSTFQTCSRLAAGLSIGSLLGQILCLKQDIQLYHAAVGSTLISTKAVPPQRQALSTGNQLSYLRAIKSK